MPTLDWLNRSAAFNTAAQVPYRLLDTASTHGDAEAAQHNLLIQGENLEALKALLPFYRRKVKIHLHRPAVQHAKRLRALRRQPGAQPVAEHDAAAPAAAARAAA